MKQKITMIIGGIIILIIGIYFYLQNAPKEEMIEESIQNTEENRQIEEKIEIIVHIIGEIKQPGIVKLKEGERVIDAIEKSGGITEKANLNQINLAQTVTDGEQIIIPSKEEKIEEIQTTQNKKININTAEIEELKKLTGIGDSLASRIIQYRKEKGKFKKIEDLKNVSGIGESKFAQIRDFICI